MANYRKRAGELLLRLMNEAMPKPETKPRGTVGTEIFSGYIKTSEFNTEWKESLRWINADKMRRTDAQVNATLLAIELPIRSSVVTIQPVSDQPIDMKIRNFVERNLFGNSGFSWSHLLRHVLWYLQFGCYVFEKVYKYEDGKFMLDDISPRKPDTIKRWIQDEDGKLDRVVQFAMRPDGNYGEMEIPNNYLLVLTHEREGNDWMGKTILRSAYRNWKIKELLIRIDAMRHERQGLGIPLFEPKEGTRSEDKSAAEAIGETLRAHEMQYMIQPDGWNVGFMDLKTKSLSNILPSLKFHNNEISTNILAQYMDIGKTEYGTRASIIELMSNFYLTLQSTANYVESIFNDQIERRSLIPQLVGLNFPNVDEFPKLKFTRLVEIDKVKVSEYLMNLSSGGWVIPKPEDEPTIREEFGLPEIQEPMTEEMRHRTPRVGIMQSFWRKMTALEKKIGMKEIDETLQSYERDVTEIGDKYRALMIDKLVETGKTILASKKSLKQTKEEIEKNEGKKHMAGKMTNELNAKLRELYSYSEKKVRDELGEQGIRLQEPIAADEDESKKAPRRMAELAAAGLWLKLFSEWSRETIRQKMAGIVDTLRLREMLTRLSNREFKREMRESVMRVFGLARNSTALKYKDKIDYAVRSEIMDENTCAACREVDGEEFRIDSPEASAFMSGPYIYCEGGDMCRGTNIFISK